MYTYDLQASRAKEKSKEVEIERRKVVGKDAMSRVSWGIEELE